MTANSPTAEMFQAAIANHARDIVGIVDHVLRLASECQLRLQWDEQRCLITSSAGAEETLENPLPKPVFRALLARFAALCKESGGSNVSPYGGESQLSLNTNPRLNFVVSFINTPDRQCVTLQPVTPLF